MMHFCLLLPCKLTLEVSSFTQCIFQIFTIMNPLQVKLSITQLIVKIALITLLSPFAVHWWKLRLACNLHGSSHSHLSFGLLPLHERRLFPSLCVRWNHLSSGILFQGWSYSKCGWVLHMRTPWWLGLRHAGTREAQDDASSNGEKIQCSNQRVVEVSWPVVLCILNLGCSSKANQCRSVAWSPRRCTKWSVLYADGCWQHIYQNTK